MAKALITKPTIKEIRDILSSCFPSSYDTPAKHSSLFDNCALSIHTFIVAGSCILPCRSKIQRVIEEQRDVFYCSRTMVTVMSQIVYTRLSENKIQKSRIKVKRAKKAVKQIQRFDLLDIGE